MSTQRLRYDEFRLMSRREQNMYERARAAGTWVTFANLDEARVLARAGFLVEGNLGYFRTSEKVPEAVDG